MFYIRVVCACVCHLCVVYVAVVCYCEVLRLYVLFTGVGCYVLFYCIVCGAVCLCVVVVYLVLRYAMCVYVLCFNCVYIRCLSYVLDGSCVCCSCFNGLVSIGFILYLVVVYVVVLC